MEIDLILNELSLRNPASNNLIARQWMSDFISTIKAIKSQGAKVNLRTKESFHTTILAPNYPIRRWLNDNDADQVERLFIKTLATKAPFSTDIANLKIKEIENSAGLSEFRYQGELAIGLGIAHLLDTMAISFPSENCWNYYFINIEFKRIDEDGEVIEENIDVIHISCSNHVIDHANWIRKRIQTGIIDGNDLWKRREYLFPGLLFCQCVEEQITCLENGNPILRQVIKRLFELEEQSRMWIDGVFDYKKLPSKASPESESRLRKFQQELTFECPDGKERIFSLHLRMTPGAWRLYFATEVDERKIIVGYVGLKLI